MNIKKKTDILFMKQKNKNKHLSMSTNNNSNNHKATLTKTAATITKTSAAKAKTASSAISFGGIHGHSIKSPMTTSSSFKQTRAALLKKHASLSELDFNEIKGDINNIHNTDSNDIPSHKQYQLGLGSSPFTTSSSRSTPIIDIPSVLWFGDILWKIPFNGKGKPERRLVIIRRSHGPGQESWPVRVIDEEGNIIGIILYH